MSLGGVTNNRYASTYQEVVRIASIMKPVVITENLLWATVVQAVQLVHRLPVRGTADILHSTLSQPSRGSVSVAPLRRSHAAEVPGQRWWPASGISAGWRIVEEH